MGSGALGGNDIGDSLGLGQIHLAVDESSARELARSGNTCTGIDKKLENLIDDEPGSVAGNLHGILAGI